jgi:hypothetical protein
MRLALSGFAGVGKSKIIDYALAAHSDFFVSTESSREVNQNKDFFKIDCEYNKIFQKSILDNEFSKIHIALLNNFKDSIFDRSIIDNLVFASWQFKESEINYKAIQKEIDHIRRHYKIDSIYTKNVLIRVSNNENFIQNLVDKDSFRKETTDSVAKNFIKKGKEWEVTYLEILSKLNGVVDNVDIINHFTENNDFEFYIKNLLKNK